MVRRVFSQKGKKKLGAVLLFGIMEEGGATKAGTSAQEPGKKTASRERHLETSCVEEVKRAYLK